MKGIGIPMRMKNDTRTRKRFFHESAMNHPAKLHCGLFLEIVERYTLPGDTVLDVMGGIGTVMLAAMYGRNAIVHEMEAHFLETVPKSWKKIQQNGPALGHTMGQALILRGDARYLPIASADAIVTSPPWMDQIPAQDPDWIAEQKKLGRFTGGFGPALRQGYTRQVDAVVSSPPYEGTNDEARLFGGLKEPRSPNRGTPTRYTSPVDAVISSPPYENQGMGQGKENHPERMAGSETGLGRGYAKPVDAVISSPPYANRLADTYVDDDPQRMSYEMGKAKIDGIITSPPYEGVDTTGGFQLIGEYINAGKFSGTSHISKGQAWNSIEQSYAPSQTNIGNQKGDAYWDSCRLVYAECHRVLRDGGVMALVVKGFTRGGMYVDLPQETIAMCESLGFKFFDHWKRELWTLSFWRNLQSTDAEETVIAHQGGMLDIPVVEIKKMKRVNNGRMDDRLRYEEIIAFRKEGV